MPQKARFQKTHARILVDFPGLDGRERGRSVGCRARGLGGAEWKHHQPARLRLMGRLADWLVGSMDGRLG